MAGNLRAKARRLKVLYLCSNLYVTRKIPRTRFHAIKALAEFCDVTVSGLDHPNWKNDQPVFRNTKSLTRNSRSFDWIIVYKPEQYTGWDQNAIPVATTFNDAWAIEQRKQDINLPRCRLVVMHHENEWQRWTGTMPGVRFEHIPYPIDPSVFKDHNMTKVFDILLTGMIDERIYPLRYRFKQLIEAEAFAPYTAYVRPHCGYRIDDPQEEAMNYARALNSAHICLFDTSCYNYWPEKIHEIAACASVPCGNMPDDRFEDYLQFGFAVSPTWSDERIVRVITNWLRQKDRLEMMADAGHSYVHGAHTTRHYARKLLKLLETTG